MKTHSKRRGLFLLVALVLCLLAIVWVLFNEVVQSTVFVGNAAPPITALTVLLLLTGVAYGTRRWGGNTFLTPGRILLTYLMVTIASALSGIASMWYFFAYLSVPAYLSASQLGMARIAAFFPSWYAPTRGEGIRRFYEGGDNHAIAWDIWLRPLLTWGIFLFILMVTLYALLALLRRSWMESERLTYPIVQIPLHMVDTGKKTSIWRSPVFWIGFGLAGLYDGVNMAHAFWPMLPTWGIDFDVGALFSSRPWSALSPMAVSYRPEILGIAYLMPTDVLLTTWVSYVGLRLSTVLRVALGAEIESTPYDYTEIGMGAFVCLFCLLWRRAWPELKGTLLEALGQKPRTDHSEPFSFRAAWSIAILGTLAMWLWLRLIGLPLWLAGAYLALLLSVAVVYARMRAETGAPMIYLFPYWQQQYTLLNFLGSQFLSGGNVQTLAIFSSLGGLSRGYYPEVCAYGAEGMYLAERAKFSQRSATKAMIAGLALGLVFGGWLYMVLGYRYGANQMGTSYFVGRASQQYTGAAQMGQSPVAPKLDLILQTLLGGGCVLLLNAARQRFFWLPLHPMGFAMASAYGFHLWAPFFVVWLLKSLTLRLGGSHAYQRLLPFFLGVALGRYLFAGIVWGLLGTTGHSATKSYLIQFG